MRRWTFGDDAVVSRYFGSTDQWTEDESIDQLRGAIVRHGPNVLQLLPWIGDTHHGTTVVESKAIPFAAQIRPPRCLHVCSPENK
jgi:hypothetical protein